MKYKRVNPHVIALIIEIALILIGMTVVSVFEWINKPLNMIPVVIVTVVLIIALLTTLSFIRYDALRNIRESDVNKDNLPLYTDQTTLMCHDIKDENRKHKTE